MGTTLSTENRKPHSGRWGEPTSGRWGKSTGLEYEHHIARHFSQILQSEVITDDMIPGPINSTKRGWHNARRTELVFTSLEERRAMIKLLKKSFDYADSDRYIYLVVYELYRYSTRISTYKRLSSLNDCLSELMRFVNESTRGKNCKIKLDDTSSELVDDVYPAWVTTGIGHEIYRYWKAYDDTRREILFGLENGGCFG